jgi:hexosaminidase
MHALTTLSQLAMGGLRAVDIKDEPRYPHRGIMVDPSRNYLTKKTLERIIDGMSFAKLNVLHVGFVNANSFLYGGTSDVVKDISAHGSMNSKQYSAKKVEKIIAYGVSRGVKVVPEFDTPAHAFSWGQAPGYEKLVQCNGMEFQNAAACPEPPCGQLNKDEMHEGGFAFDTVRQVWTDMMGTMKKSGSEGVTQGSSIHLGADEVNAFCWGGEPGDDWKTTIQEKRDAATKISDDIFLPWVKKIGELGK